MPVKDRQCLNAQLEGLEDNKQLLDEVFVISGIIKVKVSVISRAEGYHKNRI